MRFLEIVLAIFVFFMSCFSTFSQETEVMISKYIKALGGKESIREIEALKLTGTLEFSSSNVKYNLTIFKMHPNLYRIDMEYQGTTVIEAYDGNEVWHIVPFDGINSPTPLNDEIQASKIKSEVDILSPLVDWKAKGYRVEYLGKETEGNEELLQLKVTFNDNYTTDYFLDAHSFLIKKFVRLERHNPRGRTNSVTTYVNDYRKISNVLFAHRFEIELGSRKSFITIEHIVINPKDITNSIFSMK